MVKYLHFKNEFMSLEVIWRAKNSSMLLMFISITLWKHCRY